MIPKSANLVPHALIHETFDEIPGRAVEFYGELRLAPQVGERKGHADTQRFLARQEAALQPATRPSSRQPHKARPADECH